MPLPRLFLRFACLLLAFAGTIRAQQPLPAGAPLQALPPLPGGVPGPLPTNVSGNPIPVPELPTVRLIFPNASIVDVLHDYEQLTGKHVIYDTTVQGTINLNVTSFVTRTEAIHLIETALNLNGFALVPTEGDVVKVIGLGKNPRQFGIPIFYDLGDVPDTDQLVTFLVHLHYLEPQETSGLLTQYIQPNPNVAFTPLVKAGAILITDTGRSVRRLVKLISEIDQPAAPVTEKYFTLQRADATKAVEFLNSLFETKATAGGTVAASNPANAGLPGLTNARRPIRRVGEDGGAVEATVGPNGALSLSGDSLIYGKLTLTPDVRTNRVYVVTSPVNLRVIESLLKEYDAGTPFATPVRFPLKFLRPDLILPILVQSLQEGTDANGNGATPGATNPNRNGQSNANNNNNSSNGNSAFGGLGGSGGLGGLGGGGSGGLGSSFGGVGGGTQEIDTTPQEQVVGSTRLIADIANSSIIVLGGADAQDKVRAILLQLDRRSPQVLIHTVIGELSLGNNSELGFQYLLRNKQVGLTNNANLFTSTSPTAVTSPGTTTGTPTNPGTTTPTTASTLSTLSTLASGLGSTFSGVGGVVAVGRSLDIILSALDSTNRFKTISRPLIVTSNFKRASITSGQTISVSTGTESNLTSTTNSSGNLFQQTTQELAALQLTVTPQINSDKEVVMEVDQQLNSPIATTSVNGSSNQQLNIRQLHNYVSARNGETIVLGGLITQDENITDSGIPYLDRIPVLGSLFKSHTRAATRSELIILMQPEVVDTAGVMSELRTRETNKTYLGPGLDNQLDPITVRRAYPVKQPRVKTTPAVVSLPTRK